MIKYYKDSKGEWRWKIVSANRKTLADSGEGYKRISGARKGFNAVKKICANL